MPAGLDPPTQPPGAATPPVSVSVQFHASQAAHQTRVVHCSEHGLVVVQQHLRHARCQPVRPSPPTPLHPQLPLGVRQHQHALCDAALPQQQQAGEGGGVGEGGQGGAAGRRVQEQHRGGGAGVDDGQEVVGEGHVDAGVCLQACVRMVVGERRVQHRPGMVGWQRSWPS